MTRPTTTEIEPVVRELVVQAPAATCYRVFVDELATWWPVEHHIGADRTVVEFRVEPFVGGRCFDIDTDGGESHWGTVLALDPPDRFAFAWHIQGDWAIDHDPAHQSEVEVTFDAIDDATTDVKVVHRTSSATSAAPPTSPRASAAPAGGRASLDPLRRRGRGPAAHRAPDGRLSTPPRVGARRCGRRPPRGDVHWHVATTHQ